MILVSTGIGLTPALSVIEQHKESRTIFLVWSTKDASMVEFFIQNYHYLDHEHGFNFIFYTGTQPLNLTMLEGLPSNVKIIQSRPNLDALIPDIIHANECSGEKSQDNFQSCYKCQAIHDILEKTKEFDTETTSRTDKEKLQELVLVAKDAGYEFSELSSHLQDAGIPCPFTVPKTEKGSRSRVSPNLPQYEMMSDVHAYIVLKRACFLAAIWNPTVHAARSVKNLEHKSSLLSRWGVMYCGGSTQVKRKLKKITSEYEIDLHYESFAW